MGRVNAEADDAVVDAVIRWYDSARRDLPWREPGCSPWGVFVSEVMLQQTPVARVLPVWGAWTQRWPTPSALAAEVPGEAVAAWGRLGYPRRALRLHAAATVCVTRFAGRVPDSYEGLRELPGVGDYTASAVAAFAFGRRQVVLDTNVRRVLARFDTGSAFEPSGAPSTAERRRADELLPTDDRASVRWNVGLMELGALVCTARSPGCAACPLSGGCSWLRAGSPPWDGPARRGQTYAGTDRQVRGLLLAVLRESEAPVDAPRLDEVWPDTAQRARALDGLVADGLVEPVDRDSFRLPGRGT
jgi:A/G-specific adenine glycosylase